MEEIKKIQEVPAITLPEKKNQVKKVSEIKTADDSVISYDDAIKDPSLTPAQRFLLRVNLKKGTDYKKSAIKKLIKRED